MDDDEEIDYGPCAYCDEHAEFWHKIGEPVCWDHMNMSVEELSELEARESE